MLKLNSKILVKIAAVLLFICCNAYALDNSAMSESDSTEIPTLTEHAYQNAHSPIVQAQLREINQIPASMNTPQNPETATSGDVLVFVSFSMPEGSLKQWVAQARRIYAPLIIRGLVNNSFTETQTKIAELITDNQDGFVLEPRLFSDYHITQVPAVVVRNTKLTCLPMQNCPHTYLFDMVTGDVGLEAALTAIANQEYSTTKEIAKNALQAERKSS